MKKQRKIKWQYLGIFLSVSFIFFSCKDNENYKDSFTACNSALKEDPNNQNAIDMRQEVRVKLTKKMRDIWDNASIEENYGNIDAAKELWLKIKKTDFKGGSQFYSKAVRKLKKYGF